MVKCPICDEDRSALYYFPDSNGQICYQCNENRIAEKKREKLRKKNDDLNLNHDKAWIRTIDDSAILSESRTYQHNGFICSDCRTTVKKAVCIVDTEHNNEDVTPLNFNVKFRYLCRDCMINWLGLNNNNNGNKNG